MISIEWLAGFFDGEGCIGIYGAPSLSLHMTLVQTNFGVMSEIQKEFGGRLYEVKRYSSKHNRIWKLSWNAKTTFNLLQKIFPYLKVKQEQAQLVLEEWIPLLYSKGCAKGIPRGAKIVSFENKAKRLEIKKRLSDLKHRLK